MSLDRLIHIYSIERKDIFYLIRFLRNLNICALDRLIHGLYIYVLSNEQSDIFQNSAFPNKPLNIYVTGMFFYQSKHIYYWTG